MGAAQRRTWEGLVLLGLVALSVRPVPVLERALDLLLVPVRGLAELTTPLGTAQSLAAGPAGGLRDERREVEARGAEDLERALLRLADPHALEELGRREGIHGMPAEVLSRPKGVPDQLEVLLREAAGIHPGLPVVCGAHLVGVVERVATRDATGRAACLATVRLVTERNARVNALALDEELARELDPERPVLGLQTEQGSPLVVGGITDAPGGQGWLLSAHTPRDPQRVRGPVVLWETEGELRHANGFYLGDLVPGETPFDDRRPRVAGVRPRLDLESGLYQLLVLTKSTPPGQLSEPESSGSWQVARQGLRADAEPGRSGNKLLAGSLRGVRAGAAVAVDQRLVGRVERVGLLHADVRRLEDPGLHLPGVALPLDGGAEPDPIVLGDLISLGRDENGLLALAVYVWPLSRAPERPVRVRLWTGSGSPGVPRGLLVGDVTLPVGSGPKVLAVEDPPGGRDATRVRVRVDWEMAR